MWKARDISLGIQLIVFIVVILAVTFALTLIM